MIFSWGRPSRSALRPLRAAQAADCASLHAGGFAYPWAQSELERLIGDPKALGAAAVDPTNARLRGFVLSRIAADEAEILTIVVDPVFRKMGVGGDLLRANLAQAAAAGAAKIFLEVDAENVAALALYHRYRFVQVGQREGYYKRPNGKTATALVLRRDLV